MTTNHTLTIEDFDGYEVATTDDIQTLGSKILVLRVDGLYETSMTVDEYREWTCTSWKYYVRNDWFCYEDVMTLIEEGKCN